MSRRDMTSQVLFDEEIAQREILGEELFDDDIWKEPETSIDPESLYGSDKMYGNTKSFAIHRLPVPKTAFGLHIKDGRLEKAGKLLLEGLSVQEVSRRTYADWRSVTRLKYVLVTINGKIMPESRAGRKLWKKTSNHGLRLGKASTYRAYEIYECGCYVDRYVHARIIACESANCCFE